MQGIVNAGSIFVVDPPKEGEPVQICFVAIRIDNNIPEPGVIHVADDFIVEFAFIRVIDLAGSTE